MIESQYGNLYKSIPTEQGMNPDMFLKFGLTKIIQTILPELDFDFTRYGQIFEEESISSSEHIKIARTCIREKRKPNTQEEERFSELSIQETQNNQLLDELIKPVYDKLIEMGYKENQLTG